MLTRLEIDGFKNLRDFAVSFGPYTCIAGPNASGKSNVFDAIQFLSALADHPLMEAAQRVRSERDGDSDPRELFWSSELRRVDEMRFAAEVIVPAAVRDDFGREAEPAVTFLRYELVLGYEPPRDEASLGRVVLRREHLGHITQGAAKGRLPWPHSADFRREVVRGTRRGGPFISTSVAPSGEAVIEVHQDRHAGRPRPSPAKTAERTIVGSTSGDGLPTILAMRREMQQWRRLALEPAAMRSPDRWDAPREIRSDGGQLAAALYRLTTRARPGGAADPDAVLSEIAARAAALVAVREVKVDVDRQRHLIGMLVRESQKPFLPARSLSDGTLRFLALSIMAEDPEMLGLLCMEEPENGIHPARMQSMVDLVRGLAVAPDFAPGEDNPLRQVIVNTHSPHFVQLQNSEDLVFAQVVSRKDAEGRFYDTTRMRPLRKTWRCTEEDRGLTVNSVVDYLARPAGAQLTLSRTEGFEAAS